MKRIGNNEFFGTSRGAKTAATRRGYVAGAQIWETEKGYCLLARGEGADSYSHRWLAAGGVISELTENGWADEEYIRTACI